MTEKRFVLQLGIAALLLGFVVYGASLSNGFVNWDDGYLIQDNEYIRTFQIESILTHFSRYDPELYIPLTFLSYNFDYAIDGLNPAVFHFNNLILHILNAVLAGWFSFLLLQKRWPGVLVGLLFLLHPLNTESVVWASARKDVLSTAFYLSSLIAYLHYIRSAKHVHYLQALLLCIFGLFSKVMLVTQPIVLLLIDYQQGRKMDRKTLGEKIPFFVLSVIFGVVAMFGKANIVRNSTIMEKGLMAAKSTLFYIEKTFFPHDFSILHPYPGQVELFLPEFFIPVLVLFTFLILFWRKRQHWKTAIFCSLFYMVTIAPTFGNFSKGGSFYIASDRYAYVGSIGLFIIIALWLERLHKRLPGNVKMLVPVLSLVSLVYLGAASYAQSLTWKDTKTLMLHTLEIYPDSYMAYDRLGGIYKEEQDYDAALAAYKRSIELNPTEARVFSNIGALYAEMDMPEEEMAALERSLELNPMFIPGMYNLARAYLSRDRRDDAMTELENILSMNRSFLDTRVHMADMYREDGRYEEAMALYKEELHRNTSHQGAIAGLGAIAKEYRRQGKLNVEEWGG